VRERREARQPSVLAGKPIIVLGDTWVRPATLEVGESEGDGAGQPLPEPDGSETDTAAEEDPEVVEDESELLAYARLQVSGKVRSSMTYGSLMTKLSTWCRTKKWATEAHIFAACSKAARIATLEGSSEELAYIRALGAVKTQRRVDELNAGAAGLPYHVPRDGRYLWVVMVCGVVALTIAAMVGVVGHLWVAVPPLCSTAILAVVAVWAYSRSEAPYCPRADWRLPPK
jgi:hypothetical protein